MTSIDEANPGSFLPSGPARESLLKLVDGARILITGGTGSFGRMFITRMYQIGRSSPLIVLSRDELKQFEMQQTAPFAEMAELRFFIGDVRDAGRLDMAMRDVDYVIHAAALKQVPAAEYNPFECIRTNVIGAQNVAQAAMRNRVKRVIALSTDKAANPINLYGASKLASDKIFVAANNLSGSAKTKFSIVRYGNVIGSRGSVVQVFEKMLSEGAKNLPITDERMTRFWMTIGEAVDFVLSCLQMMRGGEIFVPKIPSMKIVDLARAMTPELPHRIIGIRPGEKLHEVLVTEDDARGTLELADRYIVEPSFSFWSRESYTTEGAQDVPENFCYASNTNSDWIDTSQIKELIRLSARYGWADLGIRGTKSDSPIGEPRGEFWENVRVKLGSKR